jgi:hypothetical protein
MGRVQVGIVTVFVLSFFACATTPKQSDEPEMTPASSDSTPVPSTEYGCATDDGEPLECTTSDECCSGYVCSVDPGRSRVRRYCLR